MKPADQETAEGILFTDQYQLTMAQLYYRMGLHDKEVQFDHFSVLILTMGPIRLVIASMPAWSGLWTGSRSPAFVRGILTTSAARRGEPVTLSLTRIFCAGY